MSSTIDAEAPICLLGQGDQEQLVRAVVAALPVSTRLGAADAGPRDALVAVAGSAGWPQRAQEAIGQGAAGVVVTAPQPEPLDALLALQDAAGPAPVVLDRFWLSHPALSQIRAAWSETAPSVELVDTVAEFPAGQPRAAAAFQQLSVVHLLTGVIETVGLVRATERGYVIDGRTADGARVSCVGLQTEAPRIRLRLSAPPRRLVLEATDTDLARPVSVTFVEADHEWAPPSVYEDSHRASWRRAVDALRAGSIPADLHEFIADVRRLQPILEGLQS